MKRTIVIFVLLTLTAIGGEMLPVGTGVPTPSTSGSDASISGSLTSTNSVKIADGLSPVIRVIDGDTIIVEIDGVQEKIRLIGVDTPEVVDPRKPVACFGKEASAFTKNLLTGVRVRMESDSTQGNRDRYGRLLRYVFLPDGMLVNKVIIAEGYGHEYTYRIPYRYQADFKVAMRTARETGRGLWAQSAC